MIVCFEDKNKWGKPKRRLIKARPASMMPNDRLGELRDIKSLDTGLTGAVSSKPSMEYTGDKMIGIATMHKSNLVPIFNSEAAQEVSKMRR